MEHLYSDFIAAQWPNIAKLYNEFADRSPVILMDVDEAELHAFPFDRIASVLDEQSRAALEQQYRRAVATRQMVLIVRDKERKQTLTFTLKLDDE